MENMTLAGAVIITGLVVVFVALIGLWFIVAIMGKIFPAISQKSSSRSRFSQRRRRRRSRRRQRPSRRLCSRLPSG